MTEQELMMTKILGCDRADLYTRSVFLSPQQQDKLSTMQTRRLFGEPLQYILEECDFMGLRLRVNPDVLVPRPETEILVEKILEVLPAGDGLRILDLGTGSGNIAVALAKYSPSAKVTTVDISSAAISVARQNARDHGVEDRIIFQEGDMLVYLEEPRGEEEPFDLIVSNPPYIPETQLSKLPEDVQREPVMALDGGEDGLKFYRHIIGGAGRLLKPGGMLALEMGDGQAGAVIDLFAQTSGYSSPKIFKDYVGTERIILAEHRSIPTNYVGMLLCSCARFF